MNRLAQAEKQWELEATLALKGKRIVDVRYMTNEEAQEMGWMSRPVVLELSDGTFVFPMADDEGNDGGALSTSNPDIPTVPVLGVLLK